MASPSKRKKSIKDTLSCPVCEELLVAPAFGCQNGHLICASCKSKIPHCSVCRAERFNVRNLTVEELLALPVLACANQKAGCNQPLMTGLEYTTHNKVCAFRPVECESKSGISSCQNQLIPYNFYLDHLKAFHGATKVNKKSFLISCDMDGSFTPKHFEAYNRTFVLQCHHNQNSLWTWLAYLGNDSVHPQKFFVKLRLRYKVKNQQLQSFVSDVFPPSNIRELNSEVFKSGRCLELKSDSCPPFIWPNYVVVEDEERVSWGYDVEIWEESAYHHSGREMSKLIFENPTPENTVKVKSNQKDIPAVNSDTSAQNGIIQDSIQALNSNINNMLNAASYVEDDDDVDFYDEDQESFNSDSGDDMDDLSGNGVAGDSKVLVPGVIINPTNDDVLMELDALVPIISPKVDGDVQQQQESDGNENQVKVDDESVMNNKQDSNLKSDSSAMSSNSVSLDSSSRPLVIKRSPVKNSNDDEITSEEEPLTKRMKIEGLEKEDKEEKEQDMEKVENANKSEIDPPRDRIGDGNEIVNQQQVQNEPISENNPGQ